MIYNLRMKKIINSTESAYLYIVDANEIVFTKSKVIQKSYYECLV